MHIDLKSMSRKELEKHLKDVKKALQAAQARDRREAQKAAEKAAAEFGYSLNELTADSPVLGKSLKKRSKKPKSPSIARFANPSDKTQTWTGKGRQPNWYREAVASGTSPDELRI